VRLLAVGLRKLGIERGDAVAIIGDNRPRLYCHFAAVQSVGGIAVPIYQDSVAAEMAYVLEHSEVKFAVVQNQEQVDKLISVADKLPKLKQVIYDEPRGPQQLRPGQAAFLRARAGAGREELRRNAGAAGWWMDEIAKGKGEDVSVMLYTSGTTGPAQGRDADAPNIVVSGQNGNLFDHFTTEDILLAYLPMAWVGDHIFSYGQAYAAAMCVCCPESPETVVEDRREIGPTYFFAPPRVFENLLTQVMVRMEDAGWLKSACSSTSSAWPALRRADPRRQAGRRHGSPALSAGRSLVYAPLRNRMGFSRTRVAYTAGEAIGPELFRFYRSLGVNLKQLYGQTEASVYITLQPDARSIPIPWASGPDVDIKGRRQRRGAVQEPRRVPQVLQERRRPTNEPRRRRLGAHGRLPASSTARPPQDHRSRQGRGRLNRRRAIRARSISRNRIKFSPEVRRRSPSARVATT
jgi:long-chain acyl-CoA synthetase